MWRRSEGWGLLALVSSCVLTVLGVMGWFRTPFMNATALDQCNKIERDGGAGLTTPAEGLFSHPYSTPCPDGDNAVPWFVNPGIWLSAALVVVGVVLWVLLTLREWLHDPGRISPTDRGGTTADREVASRAAGSSHVDAPAAGIAGDDPDDLRGDGAVEATPPRP